MGGIQKANAPYILMADALRYDFLQVPTFSKTKEGLI